MLKIFVNLNMQGDLPPTGWHINIEDVVLTIASISSLVMSPYQRATFWLNKTLDLKCSPGANLLGVEPSELSVDKKEKNLNPLYVVCLFCCFTSQVNSYGHCGTVSSPNHTFSWAGLNKRLTSNSCTYFRL